MNVWHIAAKDLRILFRDIPGLVYLFITPLIVIAVASFALSGLFSSEVEQFPIPIVVEDSGQAATDMVTELQKVSAIKLLTTYADKDGNEQKMTREEAKKQVAETKAAIVIPSGFSAAVEKGEGAQVVIIKDPVDRVIPGVVSDIVSKYVSTLMIGQVSNTVGINSVHSVVAMAQAQNVKLDPTQEIQKVQDETQKYIDNPPVKVATEELDTSGEHQPTPFESNVPGYAVMFVLLGTASAAAALIEERENGTLRKLQTLPINPMSILGGKMLSNFLTATLQCIILFAVGHFVFGMWLGKSMLGLLLVILCTAFAATGLAMLLAALCKTRSQANGVSILLVLTMSALGGSWWPLYIVPEWMQTAAHVTLTAWAMDGFNNLLIYSKGLSDVLLPASVLFGMGVVFLGIAVRRFRFQ